MADSIPKLRRLLNEANEKIRELEARGPVEVEKIVYRDVPVDRVVERVVTKEVEKVVAVPGPVVTKEVEKLVTVPGPAIPGPREVMTIERVVYQDNPDHIETIKRLQERLCQYTSQ